MLLHIILTRETVEGKFFQQIEDFFCPPKGFLVTKMFLKQTFFFLNSSNHIDFEVLNLNLNLNCYKYNLIRMLLSISKVYPSYKSDKKLLAAIASRQKGQKYLQFAQ